ncbi:MAG: N-acetylmuramoyl-L-alanine amidase [Bryobacterales bacterium]|nr:N-acetylmuramoyl-L-alanine amidase [Bryobacterales bacterium]
MAPAGPLPSESYLRLVERHGARIADPAARLRFVRSAREAYVPGLPGWAYVVRSDPPAIRVRRLPLGGAGALAVLLLLGLVRATATRDAAVPPAASIRPVNQALPRVWLVEKTGRQELYSNGLRIEERHAAKTSPRRYRAFARRSFELSEPRTRPAGIVFHSSESPLAPFEAVHNARLKHQGSELLEYVVRNAAYHFLIDRFGRVFRVVAEGDSANHAGNSVWADAEWIYLNLNHSFLAVSFEAQTGTGSGSCPANPAQVQAARVLVEMLRGRYGIPPENCVTHAQVSVNAASHAIGYHTDWGRDFPFREIGLPDGYRDALPSITAFGFGYDAAFLTAIGGQVWPGLLRSEEQVLRDAAAGGLTPAAYRKRLQRWYRELAARARMDNTQGEDHEQGM